MLTKGFRQGTHRSVAPEATWQRIAPLFAAMGITRVANVTGLDTVGIPVVAAYRPNARSLSVAQGKGITLMAANVSGAMEAIESYHAEHCERPLVYASHEQLERHHRLVDVDELPRSAAGRYAHDRKIHWTTGIDLTRAEQVLVPFDLVHTDYTLPLLPGSGGFMMNSNGLASGNHLCEAISHGVSEVVERDANTLHSLLGPDQQRARRVDLGSIDDPVCSELLARFARADLAVAVWNATSDIELPVFQAVVVDRVGEPGRAVPPSLGSGCHPSRAIALARALTEAAQGRLTVIAGSRDDLLWRSYRRTAAGDHFAELRQRVLSEEGRASFREAPSIETEDLEEDLAEQRRRLARAGFESLIVVDLTLPAFQVPVVRVIVPSLEGIHEAPDWVMGKRGRDRVGRA